MQESASTVVYALSARSAVGREYASTVVSALIARSAVGHQSASTVVGAIHARSAAGLESASTVVSAIDARSAVGQEYASTVVSALSARSARSSERIINQTNIVSRRVYIVNTHTQKYDIYSTFDGPVLVSSRLKVWLKVSIIFEPRGNLAFTHLTI